MRNSLAAIVLCIFAAVAGAQSVTEGAKKNAMNTPALLAGLAAPAPQPDPRLTRTKIADADAQDDLPMDDEAPVLRQGNPMANAGEQRPRRATPAMLLAVVAVMTGIALRRYGTPMR